MIKPGSYLKMFTSITPSGNWDKVVILCYYKYTSLKCWIYYRGPTIPWRLHIQPLHTGYPMTDCMIALMVCQLCPCISYTLSIVHSTLTHIHVHKIVFQCTALASCVCILQGESWVCVSVCVLCIEWLCSDKY